MHEPRQGTKLATIKASATTALPLFLTLPFFLSPYPARAPLRWPSLTGPLSRSFLYSQEPRGRRAMFSFRRKPRKSEDTTIIIRHSPSLPQLNAQGIPWPEHLVDLSGIPDAPITPPKGAAKTLFDSEVQGPIPFHVPWSSPGKPAGGHISSLYMAKPPPPSSFETRKSSHARPMLNLRKARAPTPFNIMVRGWSPAARVIPVLTRRRWPVAKERERHRYCDCSSTPLISPPRLPRYSGLRWRTFSVVVPVAQS